MDKLATENLFLLEFLVDDVKMDGKCDCDTPPGELCVSFQFLDNEALEVCEADFSPGCNLGQDDSMKSGKSCLFSLTPQQVWGAQEMFDVMVTVFKKMQPGWLPDKISVGSALISITNLFRELIQCMQTQKEQAPAAKTLKDTFSLLDGAGTTVGKISIYIRMSCFGKLIVTQFQMNLEDQSVLFKDKGGQSLYRYKKAKKDAEPDNQMPYPPSSPPCPMDYNGMFPPPNPTCPMTPCFPDPGMYQQFQEMVGCVPPMSLQSTMLPPMGQQMLPCSECNMMMGMPQAGPQQPPCFSQGMLTPCEECGTLLPPQFKEECPPSDPPGNYQEIGASMGGNALTIRVHRDKNKIEQVDCTSTVGSEGSCCCSPGNIGAKKSKKQVPCQVTTGGQTYDMRPGIPQGDQHLPFSFKMSGTGASPNNNITVNPPVSTKPDGTKFAEISDPNKEMFVLRIGKKSEGIQKKANLELELCTPRGPELKPIPKKETIGIQYDPADCPGGKSDKKGKKKGKGAKGKGAKGKGGKGKKGKKGKKKK